MHLKKIALKGFKSFADKTEVEFNQGMTCIVGPNGSGKSNIGDAVRWVLGEQSVKSLRGGKMEDVIFAGTKQRKPLSYAEISLEIDNHDKKMDIEYTDVEIRRRVYRSGESSYYINQKECRLKDIKELFMDTGIGVDGYSIIGQGKVDEIINSRPLERRAFFDEAVGIVKYKSRKKEAEQKLEDADNNLSRITDILFELEGQIGPLKKQSEDAKAYLNLREGLKILEVNFILDQVHESDLEKEELAKRLAEFTSEKEKCALCYEDLKNQMEKERADLIACDMQESNLEKEYAENEQLFREKEKNYFTLMERIRFTEQEQERLKSEIEMQKDKREEQEDKLSYFKENNRETQVQIEEKEALQADLNQKEEEIRKQIEICNETLKALAEKNLQKRQRWADLNTEIKLRFQKKEQQEAEALRLQKENGLLKEKAEKSAQEMENLSQKIESYQNLIADAKGEMSLWAEKETKAREVLLDLEKQKERLLLGQQEVQTQLKYYLAQEKEYRGYQKGVKALILEWDKNPGIKKNIHGVLVDLMDVEAQYALAIDTALGNAMQNVVVEDTQTAKQMIAYLKDKNLGRATFLPLDVIEGREPKKLEDKILEDAGFIGLGYECIRFSASYLPIMQYLLGKVLICKDIESADRLARMTPPGFRYVTLEGDVVLPKGAMTGGSVQNSGNLLLSRKKDIEKCQEQIENMGLSLKIKIQEMTEAKDNLAAVTGGKERALSQMKEAGFNMDLAKERLRLLQGEIEAQREDYEAKKQAFFALSEGVEALEREIGLLHTQKEMEAAQELQEDTETKEWNHKLAHKSDYEAKLQKEKMAVSIEIEKLQERKNHEAEKIEAQKETLAETAFFITKMEESILQNEGVLKSLGLQIQDHETIRAHYEQASQRLKEKTDENKSKRVSLRLKVEKRAQEAHQVDKDMLQAENDIQATLNKQAKLEQKNDIYKEELWQNYELSLLMAEDYYDENLDRKGIKSAINQKKSAMKELGDVNIRAIEEYIHVSERYQHLSDQKEDLTQAKETLAGLIDYLDEKMTVQFKENMKRIRENFQESFQILFDGGKTNIVLSEPEHPLESGIEIEVQPPGKNLQNMMLLSGGEKALTAISLLFGILKRKPTPFCLLDEIEAALDDANVNKFARYLKSFEETQFIIITHRKGTMELADTLYGVTMQEKGVSSLISVELKDYDEESLTH